MLAGSRSSARIVCGHSRGTGATARQHGLQASSLASSRPSRGGLLRLRVAQPLPLEAATNTSSAAAVREQQQQLGLTGASSGGPVVVATAPLPLQQYEAAAAGHSPAAEPHLQATVPNDVLREFEHKLEADLQSVAVTLTAVTGVSNSCCCCCWLGAQQHCGVHPWPTNPPALQPCCPQRAAWQVIIFWRGVWSLLDYFMGDSLLGDICCIVVGLSIVLWIRLSGVKVAPTFWPPS